jgi:hypothetical protein
LRSKQAYAEVDVFYYPQTGNPARYPPRDAWAFLMFFFAGGLGYSATSDRQLSLGLVVSLQMTLVSLDVDCAAPGVAVPHCDLE